ncbi:MAG: spore cortex-lytic enzyme [Firmicutes bacterium]|nr:spore cortex-lytic enzyme [Bacillota bacterium]
MKKVWLKTWVLLIVLMSFTSYVWAAEGLVKQGSAGDAVFRLQNKLHEYGYYHGEPDGVFGATTKEAVEEFQQDSGLVADGVAGPATWSMLDCNSSVSRGEDSRTTAQVVSYAKQYLGRPYVWAGRSPSGFDCSGFVSYIFEHFGIHLPRMADEQFNVGVPVLRQNIRAGDVVFFTTYEEGASHVGIYVGGGYFIHASSAAGEVTLTPINKTYYQERYLGARRVIR